MSDLEKTMDDVIDSQPDVSGGITGDEHGVVSDDSVDNYGRRFDPSLHVVDDEGKPKLTKKGRLYVQRGKSPSKIKKDKAPSTQPDNYHACAQVVCGTIFGFGQLVAGDDGIPSKDQADFMIQSYERYFESQDIEDIPPGLAVFLSTTAYVLPLSFKALAKKESKLFKAKEWVKRKFEKKDPETKE